MRSPEPVSVVPQINFEYMLDRGCYRYTSAAPGLSIPIIHLITLIWKPVTKSIIAVVGGTLLKVNSETMLSSRGSVGLVCTPLATAVVGFLFSFPPILSGSQL